MTLNLARSSWVWYQKSKNKTENSVQMTKHKKSTYKMGENTCKLCI